MNVRARTPVLTALVGLAVALGVAISPADANRRKKDSPAPDDRKTLEATVDGMEKIPGLVTFYRSPEKLYLEIPEDLIGEPLGFAAVRVKAAGDFVPRGETIDSQLVVWDQRGDHLVLTKKNLDFRAAPGSSMNYAVEFSFPDSPAFGAPLMPLAEPEDGSATPLLIDATEMFGPGLAELLSPLSGFAAKPGDGFLVSVKAFPDNVVARMAYGLKRTPGGGADGGGPASPFARFLSPGRLADPRSVEVTVDYNFFRLPDDGFRPRAADERIGGFVLSHKDYTGIDHRDAAFHHTLIRWDVRKTDADAARSPAVEPVTFYIDKSVPDEWRELLREAALWWNPAFERVGVTGAIEVLDQPDDPDWDPADIHHSMIYWNLTDDLVFSGLAGPTLFDPRTGKVLKSNVYLNGEFFSYALHRYLVYAWWRAPEPGASIASVTQARQEMRRLRAQPFFCDRAPSFSSQMAFARLVLQSRGILEPGTPEADRYAREAFAELVAHEVGHALGFPHNWKASLTSSWEDVVSGELDGHNRGRIFSSSVMDYNPIYLAPSGMPQGDYFMRELGPYDFLAVDYIYRPLDGMTPGEEARALDAIAARAEIEPGLIYDSGELGNIDPTTNSDDIGDSPLDFAESRLALLHREVIPNLAELVLSEGHDYNHLREALDAAVFSIAMDYIDISARHVGGQILLRRVAGSAGASPGGPAPITPVPAETQRRALQVLARHVFAEGAFALSAETLSLLKADLLYDWNYPWRYASDYSIGARIAGLYETALSTLLEPARLARILDNERRAGGGDAFTVPELFAFLEMTAFGDLADPELNDISVDRRALHRLLVAHMIGLVAEPAPGTPAEASQLAAALLASIEEGIQGALEDSTPALEGYARAHLLDLASRIERNLDPEIVVPIGR